MSRGFRVLATGLAGGLLGAVAMNTFARLVLMLRNGSEADGAAPGRDRIGRGVQPPQALSNAGEDGAVVAGAIVYRTLAGRPPAETMKPWLGSAAHYGFSAAVGLCYALLAERAPFVRAGCGTVYGTVVWAVADELAMPTLRLSRRPSELSRAVHAYALVGHWVYAAALESTLRFCGIHERLNIVSSHRPDRTSCRSK
jgi:uncharacterized membrane protein YagU involved in acid resistance